jgi:flagellar assembly protein FliH
MDGFAHFSRGSLLFAEDFDLPEVEAVTEIIEPEVIEPTFSLDELTKARETAWHDGHSAGLQQAAADSVAAVHETVAAIAAQLIEEREDAALRAEMSAQAIASVLLDSFAATFPALCAEYGDAEVRSVVRVMLPALMQEPAIKIRAHPRTAEAVAEEVARLDPDLVARVQTLAVESMAPGDVRVSWRNGSATRDAAALWQQVLQALAPIGETIDGG